MPYLARGRRIQIEQPGYVPINPGELNYAISALLRDYLGKQEFINHNILNEVVGVMECAKQEFIRQVVNPYEDQKLTENGKVYE